MKFQTFNDFNDVSLLKNAERKDSEVVYYLLFNRNVIKKKKLKRFKKTWQFLHYINKDWEVCFYWLQFT